MPIVPLPNSLRSVESRSKLGWLLVRVVLSGVIGAHGWARLLAGGVIPFGGFLDSQGFPAGFYWAAAVTALEIVGSLLLLLGRWVAPLAVIFSAVYLVGIALVHAKVGWFVVGLGRNGAEFSVLLVVGLLALALQHVRSAGEA
jgi:putative oxidoreductase